MERVTLHSEGTPLCSFKSAASVPIRSLKAHFTPTQNGSGDPSPSNVREIVGRTSVTVYRTAKNLLDPEKKRYPGPSNMRFYCGIDGFDGLLLNAGTYTLSYKGQKTLSGIYVLNMAWDRLAYKYNTKALTFTLSQQTTVCFDYYLAGGDVGNDISLYQLEVGSSATDYEPYTEISTQVTFPSNGKNRVDRSTGWTNGCYEENTGRILTNGRGYRDNKYIAVIPGENYTMSWSVYGFDMRVVFYNADKRVTRTANYSTQTGSTFAIADDEHYIRICQTTNTNYGIPEGLQIEHGSAATAYEAYSSDNTFYGGYVDPVKGVLSSDWEVKVLNGNLSENDISITVLSDFTQVSYIPYITKGVIGDHFYASTMSNGSGGLYKIYGSSVAPRLFLGLPNTVTTKAEAISWFESNPTTITYLISSSIEFPLDSNPLNTFDGQNYTWSTEYRRVEVDYDLFETKMIQDAKKRSLAYNQPHLESQTGSIVSFTPQVRAPIKELKCEFQPIQDLHGYDYPWPAGSGKNIMPHALAGSITSNGITVTSDGKGRYFISGTATSLTTITFDLVNTFMIPVSISNSGTGCFYLGNSFSSSATKFHFLYNGAEVDFWACYPQSRITYSYTVMGNKLANGISFEFPEGSTYPQNAVFTPYITNNNSYTEDFTPYENVCPIEGRTEANVYRTNKSLMTFLANSYTNTNQQQYNGNVGWMNNLYDIDFLIGKTVTYSVDIDATNASSNNNAARVWAEAKDGSWKYLATTGNLINAGTSGKSKVSVAITDDIKWIVFGLQLQSGGIASNPMVELGSSNTEYEAQVKTTIPIEFPATKNLFNPNAEFTIGGTYAYWKYLDTEDNCIVSLILKDSSVDLTGCSFGYMYSPDDAELGYNWIISDGSITSYNKRNKAINGVRRVGDVICKYVMVYPNTDETRQKILSAYDIQIERGSTVTSYEPYGTIYGGYIDPIKGTAVVEWAKVIYNGTETFVNYTNVIVCYPSNNGPKGYDNTSSTRLCSRCGPTEFAFSNNGLQTFQFNKKTFGVNDNTELKALFSDWNAEGKPIEICYKLAIPIVYQLTPTQLKAFKDQNNIWSDLNGNTTVKYWTH